MRHNQLLKALCHHGWQCYQFLFMDACHLALRGHQYYQYTFTTLDLNGERLKITAKSPDSLSEQVLRVWSGVLSGPDIVQGFTFAKDLLTLASVNKIRCCQGSWGPRNAHPCPLFWNKHRTLWALPGGMHHCLLSYDLPQLPNVRLILQLRLKSSLRFPNGLIDVAPSLLYMTLYCQTWIPEIWCSVNCRPPGLSYASGLGTLRWIWWEYTPHILLQKAYIQLERNWINTWSWENIGEVNSVTQGDVGGI